MRTDRSLFSVLKTSFTAGTAMMAFILLAACNRQSDPSRWDARETVDLTKTIQPMVPATVETDVVRAKLEEDSADDPAIWVNPSDPSKSVIVGTNKKAGIHVYDLKGKELQFLEVGLVNNVDVRCGLPVGETLVDIAAASNRSHQSVDIFKINPTDGKLEFWDRFKVTDAIDEVYGFCLAKDPQTARFYAIANGKNGVIEQWEIQATAGSLKASLVRSLKVPSQPEGMVSDDIQQRLFVGEEEAGIWQFSLLPESKDVGMLLEATRPENNKTLATDIEGITIYYLDDTRGYLLASSQGNHSYAVFDRNPPFSYLGSFSIKDTNLLDGVEETDGIDVTNVALSVAFPNGFFVVQDGYNLDENGKPQIQNFKLVPWESIATVLNLEMNPEFAGWR